MMVDRHRNSFSHVDHRQKWNYVDHGTLIDMLSNENDIIHGPLTLAPIKSSNIYARRHSTHAVASREDKTSAINNTSQATTIPLQPPPVPKRTPPAPVTPVFIPTDEPRNRQIIPPKTPKTPRTPKERNAVPPPLPPTPKTRAPPFNQFTNHKPTLPPTREHSTENHRKTDVNRNTNRQLTNFPFDHMKITEFTKNQKSSNNTKVNTPTTPNRMYKQNMNNKMRQDSGISTDSFSQNSSPSYTTKMETPLIPSKNLPHKAQNGRLLIKQKETPEEDDDLDSDTLNGITKSVSTPASLQTVVKFHNGSNMTLHHRIIRDMRRPSENYKTKFFCKFRFAQILVNAIVLFAIGAGMIAYYKAYPTNIVTIVNETIINVTSPPIIIEKKSDNPAPGICLPVIVRFCQQHNLPYNYTVYPNYVGHFSQRDAQQDLEIYDAVVDVRCYELTALFLCTIFVPKCGPEGGVGRPCRNICMETKRRCGFFLDVFGLGLPKYLECSLFPDSPDPNVCIGHAEFKAVRVKESRPICPTGFQCDVKRCIPKDWQCDGHVDCKDQSDELNCKKCGTGMIHCGSDKCINQEHMCDGKVDCPWGQDERNCLRLSERNGDEGRGQLEVFRPDQEKWVPACIAQWDEHLSKNICFLLGYATTELYYRHTNYSRVLKADDRRKPHYDAVTESRYPSKAQPHRRFYLIREFASCNGSNYPTVDLVCSNFICGKARKSYAERKRTPRIVGGVASKPGDWPFLAALLGGPEEIFYCAGVLIADQWVLTASHCVGNHSNISGWTIQLGITRRHSHSFYGQKVKVKRVVPHPMYNQGVAHDNDVALFQLSSRVTFHEHLLPVCLPKPNKELKPGTICTVIGWGKKEDSGGSEYEPEINEVEVPVLNRDLCNSWLEHRDLNVTEGMICAGYKEGGKDACQGDSGGPLLCREKDDPERWFVGGIVSWGIKCAHPHLPGVYAYVPKYIDWIQEQMKLYSGK